jgi:NAD(P)-dependent dehydrogenase (short-subunit alcohol dehydrogenase family)
LISGVPRWSEPCWGVGVGRVVVGDILDDSGSPSRKRLVVGSFHSSGCDGSGSVGRCGRAAVRRFRRLDALVNNAGIVKMAPLRGSSLSDWRASWRQLTGAYLGMRAVIDR